LSFNCPFDEDLSCRCLFLKVIQGSVEDVQLPDGIKADILVSEWMGFYLLHEGMLDSVLNARDRLLKPGGAMFPEKADLWAAPCSLPAVYDFWDDVHGVSISIFFTSSNVCSTCRPLLFTYSNSLARK